MPLYPTFNMTGFCGVEPGRPSPRSERVSFKAYGVGLVIVLNSTVEKASSLSQSMPNPLFSFLQMRSTSVRTVWGGGMRVASRCRGCLRGWGGVFCIVLLHRRACSILEWIGVRPSILLTSLGKFTYCRRTLRQVQTCREGWCWWINAAG